MTSASDVSISASIAERAEELVAACISEGEAHLEHAVQKLCEAYPDKVDEIQDEVEVARSAGLNRGPGKDDSWARHHYLYGLVLGIEGNRERALWELDMALRREPYEDARIRIRQVISLLESPS